MTCRTCGTDVAPGAAFCTTCGTAAAATTPAPGQGGAPGGATGVRSTIGGSGAAGPTPPPTPPPPPGVTAPLPPTTSYPPSGGYPVSGGYPTGGTPPPGPPPPAGPGSPPPGDGGRRGGRKVIGAALVVIGLLAAVLVGALAFRALRGEGGGASSPEAAVTSFAEAISAEDPVGAAAVLSPDEVRSLGDLLGEVSDTAEESGFSDPDDALAGIDLEVSDLDLEVDELSDDVARVTIRRGEASYRIDRAALGGRAQGLVTDSTETRGEVTAEDIADIEELDQDPFLVTVRRGGGWYISLTHTAAEYAREIWDLPEPDFDQAAEPGAPAEEPEDAVVALVEAGGQLDAEATGANLPADEWGAIFAYERAITEVLEGDADEVDLQITDVEVTVDDTDLRVEDLAGGARRVEIRGAEGDASWDDGDGPRSATWELDGWCLLVTEDDGDTSESCLIDDRSLVGRALDLGDPFVVVEPERGGWVVSPVSTVLQMGREALPQLTPDLVVVLIGRPDLVAPAETPAVVGEVLDIELGPTGVATHTLQPDADVEVSLSVGADSDTFVDLDLIDVASGERPSRGVAGRTLVAGREYRLVVEGDANDIGETIPVAVGEVVIEDLPGDAFSAGVGGTVTEPEPVRVYRFTPTDDLDTQLVIESGSVFASIEGETFCEPESPCSLSAGSEYSLVVELSGDSAQEDFEIAFAESSGFSIDGSTIVSDFAGSGQRNLHLLNVDAGVQVLMIVTPLDGSDLVVELDGQSFDSGFSGDEERITITGPFRDEEVVVRGFAGQSTDYEIVLLEQ